MKFLSVIKDGQEEAIPCRPFNIQELGELLDLYPEGVVVEDMKGRLWLYKEGEDSGISHSSYKRQAKVY